MTTPRRRVGSSSWFNLSISLMILSLLVACYVWAQACYVSLPEELLPDTQPTSTPPALASPSDPVIDEVYFKEQQRRLMEYVRDQRPSLHIQWTCAPGKLICQSRRDWSHDVDRAYHVYRGERDLQALLERGRRFLLGGSNALVNITPGQLEQIIADMVVVNARGDFLQYRIMNEKHRDFELLPTAKWHRSQVRKAVALAMIDELNAQTAIYSEIAAAFPVSLECDSIACKIGEM